MDAFVTNPRDADERALPPRPKLGRMAWIPGEKMDYGSWVREGARIGSFARASSWWVGDWLHFGTEKWGERYAKAAKITGYDPKTLRNLRYVASRFPLSLRRDNLTWSHHALLVSLGPNEQNYWLDLAASESLSVEDLRMELRRVRREQDAQRVQACSRGDPKHSATVAAEEENGELLCPQCGYRLGFETSKLSIDRTK
jgi:hypothetical protein